MILPPPCEQCLFHPQRNTVSLVHHSTREAWVCMARIFLVVVSLQQKWQSSYRQKGKGKVLVEIPTRMFKTEETLI